jgi:hypothetical protein
MKSRFFVASTLLLVAFNVSAQDCSKISNRAKRLQCFDQNATKPPSSCLEFEKKSNELLDRFHVGFQGPGDFQPILGQLLTTFNACKSEQPASPNLFVYEKTLQAYMAINESWSAGIQECQLEFSRYRQMGIQVNECKWQWQDGRYGSIKTKELKEKYPIIKSTHSYGDINIEMLASIKKF